MQRAMPLEQTDEDTRGKDEKICEWLRNPKNLCLWIPDSITFSGYAGLDS